MLASEQGPFGNLPPEMQVKILEESGQAQKFGEVSKDFKAAMETALKTHTVHINASQLTKDSVETLKQVGDLNLQVDNADDATMSLIGQLTNLKMLSLSGNQLSDAGLAYISELINLEDLVLADTQITNAGLQHLYNLKKLQEVDVKNNTHVTYMGIVELERNLPNAKIAK